MRRRYLVGLDVGGGSGRCAVVDLETRRPSVARRAWSHPRAPGTGQLGYDLDLPVIWRALCAVTREALEKAGARPAEVAGVAVTAMRFAMVVIDAAGEAVYAGPNRDARAVAEGLALAARDGAALYERTGHWPGPIFAAARLQWLLAQRPEAAARARVFLAANDWVAHRLCGELATDPSQAGCSLLFGLREGAWDWDWIEKLGLPAELFPPVRPAGSALGALRPEAAHELGLLPGTPVAVGGADSQCGALGAGALAEGDVAAVAGTTTPLLLVRDEPLLDPEQRLWTGHHVVAGRFVVESNAGPAGEVLARFAELLCPEASEPVAQLLAEAAAAPAGAAGALSSLGAQVMNARELALPVGSLSLCHLTLPAGPEGRAALARAVAEGLAYALRANLEQLAEVAGDPLPLLRLAGGLARSRTFAQLLADALGRPVAVAHPEATAVGAAICAGVGAGLFADLAEGAAALAAPAATHPPDAGRAAAYAELYATWQGWRRGGAEAEAEARSAATQQMLRRAGETAAAPPPSVRPRILVTADMDEEALAALGELGDVEYQSFRSAMRLLAGPALVEALRGVGVFVTEVDVVDAAALRALPELRVLAACRGDAVNVDVAACTAFGVPVLHAPGRNAEAVADLTLAFLLMLARKLPEAERFLREPGSEAGDMARMGQAFGQLQGRELWRKSVGLVGLGAVGRAVARRLRGFGARVLAHDPLLPEEAVLRLGAEPVSLDELLERSDFVSLHAAVTERSRGLIGAAELRRMRPGACLVNTARAALVNEEALAQALESGHLGGAALDVFSVEPPGCDHPLLQLPGVIATPHVGGNTAEVAAHQGSMIAEDLERLLRGERPRRVLNPEALEGFDWARPRPEPDAERLAALARRPGPAVSDLQRERKVSQAEGKRKAARAAAVAPAAAAAPAAAPREVAEKMERILRRFCEEISADAELGAFGAEREVTLHFVLADLGLAFHVRLGGGAAAALGAPDRPAEVQLRMPADVLDGMFTGRVNPMQAAMSGRLAFTGDAAKAMTLQHIQPALARCYRAARDAVGDPGDLSALAAPTAAPAAAAGPEDPRQEIVEIVDELYASGVITATGGNVSVRIPDREELWITPSQMFKGKLRPELLVRLDLQGNALDPNAPAPSSERLMHCAAYRARKDARAVVHAHAPHATILANADLPFLPISTEAAFFGNIPRVPFIMPGTRELADAVAEALAESWAVLMRNHGLLVAGRSLRRAADMVEIIERSSEIILGCYAVGREPPTLPEEVVTTLRKMGDLVA